MMCSSLMRRVQAEGKSRTTSGPGLVESVGETMSSCLLHMATAATGFTSTNPNPVLSPLEHQPKFVFHACLKVCWSNI